MYLANDVIQNSKKKGPEYGKEFQKVLQKAFLHIGETCTSDDKTLGSLGRILKIWEERSVYDAKLVQGFRDALNRENNGHSPKIEPIEKRKRDDEPRDDGSKRHKSSKHEAATNRERERVKSETVEVNGMVETHVILSPQVSAGDPPEPEELIKALIELENSASSDAIVREQIANLPPEVSEVAMLSKLEDKEQAAKLVAQVTHFEINLCCNDVIGFSKFRSMKPPKFYTNITIDCALKWKIAKGSPRC